MITTLVKMWLTGSTTLTSGTAMKMAEVSTAPYTWTWQRSSAGIYRVGMVIRYAAQSGGGGQQAISYAGGLPPDATPPTPIDGQPFAIAGTNQPPLVAVFNPYIGTGPHTSLLKRHQALLVTGQAFDRDGAVTKLALRILDDQQAVKATGTPTWSTAIPAMQWHYLWKNPFAGTFTVEVTATDDAGQASVATQQFIIPDESPLAQFDAPYLPSTPLAVYAVGEPVSAVIRAWDWNGTTADLSAVTVHTWNGTLYDDLDDVEGALPRSVTWQTAGKQAGEYYLAAAVEDEDGNAGSGNTTPFQLVATLPQDLRHTSIIEPTTSGRTAAFPSPVNGVAAAPIILTARYVQAPGENAATDWRFVVTTGGEPVVDVMVDDLEAFPLDGYTVYRYPWTPGTPVLGQPYTVAFKCYIDETWVQQDTITVTFGNLTGSCVHLLTPRDQASYPAGRSITLRAQPQYLSKDIPAYENLEFYAWNGSTGQVIASASQVTYDAETRTWSATWANPPAGTYSVYARWNHPGAAQQSGCPTSVTVTARPQGWMGAAPSAGGVNLANGYLTLSTGVDLAVYNPHGPSVAFGRAYSTELAVQNQQSPGLAPGWMHNFDIHIHNDNGHYWLVYPDRTREDLGTTPTAPDGAPYLVSVDNGDILITGTDLSQWTFDDSQGFRLTRVTDKLGHYVTFGWDAGGTLTTIANDQNATLMSISYAGGDIAGVTDALHTTVTRAVSVSAASKGLLGGSAVAFAYDDPHHDLLSTINPPSPFGPITITYHEDGRVRTITDPNGNSADYLYEAMDEYMPSTLVVQRDAAGNVLESARQVFDSTGMPAWSEDTLGRTTSTTYGVTSHRLEQVTHPDGTSATTTYGGLGQVSSTLDPQHNTGTQYTYTTVRGMPMPTSTQRLVNGQPEATLSTTVYNTTTGLVESVISPRPSATDDQDTVTTAYTYDALGNVTAVDAPAADLDPQVGRLTQYGYTDATRTVAQVGQPVRITAVNNGQGGDLVTTITYDSMDRVTAEITPTGRTEYVYNTQNPDQLDAVYAKTLANATINSVLYEYAFSGGPVTAVKLRDANDVVQKTTSYTLGKAGEVLAITGNGETQTFALNARGGRPSIADGRGNTSTFFEDHAGQQLGWLRPGRELFSVNLRDDGGRVLQTTDGVGQVVTHNYDDGEQGEGTTRNYLGAHFGEYPNPAVERNTALTYTALGWLSGIQNGVASTATTYFDLLGGTWGQETTANNLTWAVTTSPYPDGSLRTMTTPAGTFTYNYDGLGRPSQLVLPSTDMAQWAYDEDDGRLERRTLPNGAYTEYTYDDQGRLSELCNYDADEAPLSKYDTFVYDDEGRYLSYVCTFPINTALSGTRSYTYDAKGRLTGETYTPLNLHNQIYAYDDAGNHTGAFHGETLTAADYDRSNQRTGVGFVYTAEGDPTTYKGDTLTFDAEHHLTSYGTALAAKYGPNGTRMWKDVGQDRTTFCYDGEMCIGQQTGTNPQDFVPIVHGPDGLIAFGETYYQFDPEGNVVHRLDVNGDLVNTSVYDAWGVATDVLPNGDPATVTDPFGYKGQVGYYTDHETGLILCTHRYYDPELGRWLTRDPIGYDGGINLYGYCGNDPVTEDDASGLRAFTGYTDKVPGMNKRVYFFVSQPKAMQVTESIVGFVPFGGVAVFLNRHLFSPLREIHPKSLKTLSTLLNGINAGSSSALSACDTIARIAKQGKLELLGSTAGSIGMLLTWIDCCKAIKNDSYILDTIIQKEYGRYLGATSREGVEIKYLYLVLTLPRYIQDMRYTLGVKDRRVTYDPLFNGQEGGVFCIRINKVTPWSVEYSNNMIMEDIVNVLYQIDVKRGEDPMLIKAMYGR